MAGDLFSEADRDGFLSGGGRGVGRDIPAGVGRRAAPGSITGRQIQTPQQTSQEISTGKHPVRTAVCDVADVASLEQLVTTLKADVPRIDTLINVAGVNKRKKAETFTPEEYDFILDINLRGTFFLSQAI